MKKRARDSHRHAARAEHVLADADVHAAISRRWASRPENIVYSDFTSEELYKEGAKRGAIDPCFPSKLGIPHVHNLLYKVHAKKPLDIIFFPMIDCLTSDLHCDPGEPFLPHGGDDAGSGEGGLHQGRRPVQGEGRPVPRHVREPLEAGPVRAADVRAVQGHPGLSPEENRRAVEEGYRALELLRQRDDAGRGARGAGAARARGPAGRRAAGPAVSQRPGREPRDSGGVPEARATRCSRRTACRSTTTSSGGCSATKWWRARFRIPWRSRTCGRTPTARTPAARSGRRSTSPRHPNLVALELSSFKCGHDAPIYTVVEEIVEHSGTPYFCFKDIDENKPTGSIRIRVETIGYFLKRYREDMVRNKQKANYRSSSSSRISKRGCGGRCCGRSWRPTSRCGTRLKRARCRRFT